MPVSSNKNRFIKCLITEQGGLRLALRCAANIHANVDRRMPEGMALASWLVQSASSLGLDESALPDEDTTEKRKRRGVSVRDWYRVREAIKTVSAMLPAKGEAPADLWLASIAARLGLDPLEVDILCLALHSRLDRRVERLFELTSDSRGGRMDFHRNSPLIALLLNEDPAAIETRLEVDGKLVSSGLIDARHDGRLYVLHRLVLQIESGIPPAADFYDQLLGSTSIDPLPWESFAHLGRAADLAAEVVRASLATGQRGINILLYGPPGTGKTSFASSLAARVGTRLRPVTETNAAGGMPAAHERFAGLRLAHRLVVPGEAILLFDEAEDLFAQPDISFEIQGIHETARMMSRVFFHHVLERGTIPVIWTANDISVLGPAVLRRMTMCLELKVPNLPTRTRLWKEIGEVEGVSLPDGDAAYLARIVPAAPALVATAVRTTKMVGGNADTARLIVEGIARAVNRRLTHAIEPEQERRYDPSLVNADCDLLVLADTLSRGDAPRAVSLLLSGPPGSGKSAWVRYLAARMGLPILQKRASDLLDPFLGGTEQNIAEAFVEARETGAFLVFDEADSLLLDRTNASRSWEITQVNEMLTWMEHHPMPFACTTNLMDLLDRACLRRFLVKTKFRWLTSKQARLAFVKFFGMDAPAGLDELSMLTPADFALVRRRSKIRAHVTPGDLVRLLAAECDGRVGLRGPIGFAVGETA